MKKISFIKKKLRYICKKRFSTDDDDDNKMRS